MHYYRHKISIHQSILGGGSDHPLDPDLTFIGYKTFQCQSQCWTIILVFNKTIKNAILETKKKIRFSAECTS